MSALKDTGERLIPELHKQSLTYGEHLARYQGAQSLVKGKVVLDIASGAGYGSALLAKTAQKVIGIDYDKDAIDYAKKRYLTNNLEFKVGNAQDLPIEDHTIDIIICLETIEHLPNPEKFIQEAIRVLKPDGIFYVSTPNDDEYTEGNEFHLHEFDFKKLSKLLSQYFKKITYYYQGSWFASGILSEIQFNGEARDLLAIKTFGQPSSQAIYYLAIATNAPTAPSLHENLVVADQYSDLNAQKEHKARVELFRDKDRLIDELNAEIKRLSKDLQNILNSKAWKFIVGARKTRDYLLPKNLKK